MREEKVGVNQHLLVENSVEIGENLVKSSFFSALFYQGLWKTFEKALSRPFLKKRDFLRIAQIDKKHPYGVVTKRFL